MLVFTELALQEKSEIPIFFLSIFQIVDDWYINCLLKEGGIMLVSLWVEILYKECIEIGVRNLRILKVSMKQW